MNNAGKVVLNRTHLIVIAVIIGAIALMAHNHISDLESQAYYEEDQVAALTSKLDEYKVVIEGVQENLDVLESDVVTAHEAAEALRRRQLDFEFATTEEVDDLGCDADDIISKIDEVSSTAAELRSRLEDTAYIYY